MIDLIEQWNNNTHIGVCVLSVFLLSVFMLYLYMWGEIGGGNGGDNGGASVRTLADGDRIATQRSRQSVRLNLNRRATGQRRRLCAQSWAAKGTRRGIFLRGI